MHFSPKLRKRFLVLVMLPAFLLVTGAGLLYFVVVHRFKDSIKFIVDRESKGRYAFDAGEANLSLWNKSILLKESVLYSRNSATADVSYHIKIHDIYFSLASSWKDLIYYKKIVADSLSITEPDIAVRVRKINESRQAAGFRPSDLMDHLESTLTRFNVHSFTLKDAAFTYEAPGGAVPLHGDHINLSVTNFTKVNNEDSHLLGSDKLRLSLGPQHWIFPVTKNEISFSRLTFDSKGQRFEIDSFSFSQKAAIDKGEVRIRADRFFFNSQHLPAIYQKEELLLDTLICVNPVLTVVNNGREEKIKDSLQRISAANNLFKLIKVNFVSVIDGQLSLQNNGRTENTAARKANLSIFNLVVDPAKDPSLHTDSIRLNLKKIEFITKDSLFRLGIDEFAIRRNDVFFRNVVFEPTSFNRLDKGVMFTAPSLLLKDISIPDLLQKHLIASGAELYRPVITLYAKRKAGFSGTAATRTKLQTRSSEAKLALFYQTLHEMSELINAPSFNITEGAVRYKIAGTRPLELNVNNLNVHILLNQLFVSDSLVDVKHAIPDLHIGTLDLVSKGLQLKLRNYRLDGIRRYNWGKQVQVLTANGMELKGSGIYWKLFDWDIYQKTKGIQIDSLHADQLALKIKPSVMGNTGKRGSDPARDLPAIRVGKLTVNKILFDKESSEKENTRFTIQNLAMDGIESVKRLFTWNNVSMNISDIDLPGKNGKTHINEVAFNNNKETTLTDMTFESESNRASARLSVPLLRLNIPLHSSNLSQLSIPSVMAENINFHYSARSEKDTLSANAAVNLQIRNLQISGDKNRLLQYGTLDAHLQNIGMRKGKMQLGVPESSLHLSNGHLSKNDANKLSLFSALGLNWENASLRYGKDSTAFSANHLAGSFNDAAFTMSSPAKINWRQLAAEIIVREGDLHYKGKKISADVAGASWDPSSNILRLENFQVIPNESREETFKKSQWQGDYIRTKGTSLTLSGIHVNRSPGDSSIHINKLILDGVAIEASRDKTIPFRHNVEKPMPTKLIADIPFLLRADSVLLHHSSVTYNEFSNSTRKWSSIPFDDLDGVILDVSNSPNEKDTLKIFAKATLFNAHIRYFSYEEAYRDPLSSFSVRSRLSPIDLTGFSKVSIPMAAVSVIKGHADTLYSDWKGNKYAATGTMNFYYDHLKIRVLDKEDIGKRSFLPVLKTWVANLILTDSRKKASAIFAERDQEKFIFNYWVKAMSSGALTAVGIKRNKIYRKKYLKKYEKYYLPGKGMDKWK